MCNRVIQTQGGRCRALTCQLNVSYQRGASTMRPPPLALRLVLAAVACDGVSRTAPYTSEPLCLAHSRSAGECVSESPEAAAASLWVPSSAASAAAAATAPTASDRSAFSDPEAQGWRRVENEERRGARTAAMLGQQQSTDAAGSLATFVAFVRARPRVASRWADLCMWHIYHRPGGIHAQPGDAPLGSVTAAMSALRVSAEVETEAHRRPVQAASVAVDLAEQVIVDGFGNTPEPLLAAELLNMAMEMERASGEFWPINWGPRSDYSSRSDVTHSAVACSHGVHRSYSVTVLAIRSCPRLQCATKLWMDSVLNCN